MRLVEKLREPQKYHRLLGKNVKVEKYDSDHLLRMLLKVSKKCRKLAIKHNQSDGFEDGGVWVARGFITGVLSKKGNDIELAVIGVDPVEAIEKFDTLITDTISQLTTQLPQPIDRIKE